MINLKVKKNPMPEQAPDIRNHNFEEVSEGYTPQMAINEAMRCLNCREKPCTHGCPVMVRIPEFIAKITEGDFEGAYQVISATSSLPRVCGRVCPQENQCEKYCVRGEVATGWNRSFGTLCRQTGMQLMLKSWKQMR